MPTKATPKPRTPKPKPVDWTWKITWRGKSWTDADLTGQHLAVLVMMSGSDEWGQLSIPEALAKAKAEVLDGFMRLFYMLAAFVVVDRVPDDTPEAEAHEMTVRALDEIRKASAEEIIGAISVNR